MREIKFRAWDKEAELMIYSDYGDHEYVWAIEKKGTPVCYRIDENPATIEEPSHPTSFELEDEIMQYTGLKDKNGKEIYEGDIVKTDEDGWIAEVKYLGDCFMCVKKKSGFSMQCNWEAFEVIGNIYENSEILK